MFSGECQPYGCIAGELELNLLDDMGSLDILYFPVFQWQSSRGACAMHMFDVGVAIRTGNGSTNSSLLSFQTVHT